MFLKLSVTAIPVLIGLLAVSITEVLLGVFVLPPFILPIFSICLGLSLWYVGHILGDRKRFYFGATFLLLTGILLLLIDSGNITLPLFSVWPFLMLFIAIAFAVSGFLHYRRIHALYAVPALVFAGLGFFFLLFSTDIIRFSLVTVVLWWFPLVFLPALVSVIIWAVKKKPGTSE
jgi:hypothetical protein